MTCFAQTKSFDTRKTRECLDFFNPLTLNHIKNTMINWTNIYFEIFSLIDLDK